MHNEIIKKYPGYKRTCSIDNLKDGCITFARSLKRLKKIDIRVWYRKDVIVLVPKPLEGPFEFVPDIDYTFTMIHNILWKNTIPKANIIGKNCFIHETAVLDVEGIHYTKAPDGARVQMKHIGNVHIHDNVDILALATIQRGIFDSTIISKGVKIDSQVNIGHNSFIGENSIIASGAILGGSTTIGRNCMIGLGAVIRNGTNICSNVIVGQGSNVVSDINEPGIYMGNPARFFKPFNKAWNF